MFPSPSTDIYEDCIGRTVQYSAVNVYQDGCRNRCERLARKLESKPRINPQTSDYGGNILRHNFRNSAANNRVLFLPGLGYRFRFRVRFRVRFMVRFRG